MNAEEFIPRAVAPERNKGLSALREVAMQSHRSAIETSVRQRLQARSVKHLLALVAAIAFGGVFLWLSARPFDAAMITGMLSFVLALPSLFHLIRTTTARPTPDALVD
jgi:hypothetical protein